MMRPFAVFALGLLVIGCGEQGAAEKAASDTRDIAKVEAAQKMRPPAQPIAPEPITLADIEANALSGVGCEFALAVDGEPIAVMGEEKGAIKLAGLVAILAADTGSTKFPSMSFEKYSGRGHAIQLTKGPGDGEAVGNESARWPGSLTIRDPYDRVVYFAPGVLLCGA
jgi:hypothetical protein